MPALSRVGGAKRAGGLWQKWPERAPLQGAKVTNRISGESDPLMSRTGESLNVQHEESDLIIDSFSRDEFPLSLNPSLRSVIYLNKDRV